MFIELNSNNEHTGWLEVICGGMFSGKTEELIRRLRRAQIANQEVMIFKPVVDNRYASHEIVSHNRTSIASIPVHASREILSAAGEIQVIGIDEAQFFDDTLPQVIRELCNAGSRVVAAGLDMDFRGLPFGPMPRLLAQAEFVTKVHAICQRCGSLASYSYRLRDGEQQVMVGEKESYEPRCRRCFFEGVSA